VNVEPSLDFTGVDHRRHLDNRMLTPILDKQGIELTRRCGRGRSKGNLPARNTTTT